ncbi:hypothetical protein FVE85_6412 [Porphyridium purpureum]|uniref:Uncharacterized protein n=1 Tax=Porphyridium purpureum TaxID=35688 RepID=A0A5J4Z808_PORPP|nr:hypothetical protein FVE85_6412 [Porphyridium purpureum]|eukprot:POR7523..scf295_1
MRVTTAFMVPTGVLPCAWHRQTICTRRTAWNGTAAADAARSAAAFRGRVSELCMAAYQYEGGENRSDKGNTQAASPSSQPQRQALQTKDTVGLFSQIGPEMTLSAVLDALRDNPREEAIDTLYAVANIDVWEWRHTFFGRAMDLGLYDSFRRVLISEPFAALLGHTERELTGAVRADSAHFLCRVRVVDADLDTSFFTIFLSQSPSFNGSERWMLDRIVYDDTCRAHA